MKTLDEHNDEVSRLRNIAQNSGNGISCPDCGTELMDEHGISLPTHPPKTPIYCPKCTYRGIRL